MSKVRKVIRIELLKVKDTKDQVQKCIDIFNASINKSMQELNAKIRTLEEILIKLEK